MSFLGFSFGVLMFLGGNPSQTDGENRVAVVVDFGGDRVETRCVSFTEAEITGFQALERSGLAVETDIQAGGAAVCRVDATGCPANDCFCSCRGGGECFYWSYWHQTDGDWRYATGGSSQYKVSDGSMEGWVWGLGSVTEASPPPSLSFTDVCSDLSPTTTINESSTPDSGTSGSKAAGSAVTYIGFASLILLLGALSIIVTRRKDKG